MNRFSAGLLAGGIIAAAGLGLVISDSKTRKRMAKSSKRAVNTVGEFIEGVTDMF